MVSRKNVLTTGEVAKICSVAPRTVSKWFDAGQLRGYRIPGSKDRRIPLDQLVRFMRAHDIPLNGLDSGRTRLLALDSDTTFWDAVARTLEGSAGYELATAATAFEAGALAQELKPQVLIVDVTLPDVTPKAIAMHVRAMSVLDDACLIGIANGLDEARSQALLQEGFCGYLSKPFGVRSLVELIERLMPSLAIQDEVRR